MRALVLTDEDAAVYGKYLTHLPEGRREELYYESYVQDCRERRATAASVFQMNNSGFHAEITLEKRTSCSSPCLTMTALRPMSTGRRPTSWRWTRD